MHEESDLNPLSPPESKIESTLLRIGLPDSALDSDVLMYRAGWAAAMAEVENANDVPPPKTTRSSIWPALAMTCAASTAVCLMLLMRGPGTGGGLSATNQNVVKVELENTTDNSPTIESLKVETPTVVVKEFNRQPSILGQLFSLSSLRLAGRRDAELENHLAEAMSPNRRALTRDSLGTVDDGDFEVEPMVPLTPRSRILFSL